MVTTASLPIMPQTSRSDVVRRAFADEGEEFVAGVLLLEDADHGRGDRRGVLLLDAAHHHAEVAGFDDNSHALRGDDVLDGVGDLTREALLHLEAASEDLDKTRDFAESDDLAVGDVGDVHLAEEGQHVVLAERVHLDVLDDDHLVIVDVEEGVVEDGVGIFVVSLGEEGQGFLDALGGALEAVTGGVGVEAADDLAVDLLGGEVFKAGGADDLFLESRAGVAVVVLHSGCALPCGALESWTGYSKELFEVSSTRTEMISAWWNAAVSRRCTSILKFSVVGTVL